MDFVGESLILHTNLVPVSCRDFLMCFGKQVAGNLSASIFGVFSLDLHLGMEKRKQCFQSGVVQMSDLSTVQLYWEFFEKEFRGNSSIQGLS